MTIKKDIETALYRKIFARNPNYLQFKQSLVADIKSIFVGALKASDTYRSLTSGQLRADFGLDSNLVQNMDTNLDKLINVYISAKKVDIVSFEIGINKSNYQDIDVSTFSYFSNGYLIDWLQWLLFAGGETVVSNYRVIYKPGAGRSRMAVMTGPNDSFSYEVPPEFAGTENSNWITRTLDSNKDKFREILIENFKRIGNGS